MLPSTIELREADQPLVHWLPRAVAVGLASANIATVAPTLGEDEYRVGGVRKVGVVRIAEHTVWLKPKTPVRRLFTMLGYAHAGSAIWTEDDFGFEEDDGFVPALAHRPRGRWPEDRSAGTSSARTRCRSSVVGGGSETS